MAGKFLKYIFFWVGVSLIWVVCKFYVLGYKSVRCRLCTKSISQIFICNFVYIIHIQYLATENNNIYIKDDFYNFLWAIDMCLTYILISRTYIAKC